MTILCYHTVEPDWHQTLAITPTDFDMQCRWLAAHRTVIPLTEVIGRLDRTWRPTGRLSAITFDDGWQGVARHAWPILRRHGLPCTVFVVADTLVDPNRQVDWVIDPPDAPLEVLSVDEIRELHAEGVEIASHSWCHADLTSLSREACVADLRRSREVIEDLLEAPVRTVAYPSGRHDQDVRTAARLAGYDAAFTLPERRETVGRYAIPRVGIYPGNGPRALRIKTNRHYLRARLHPAHDLVRRLRSAH